MGLAIGESSRAPLAVVTLDRDGRDAVVNPKRARRRERGECRAMVEAVVPLSGCRSIEARCWGSVRRGRNGGAIADGFARLKGGTSKGGTCVARRRLVRGVIFDARVLDGGAIIGAFSMWDGRAMLDAVALVLLPDGRTRGRRSLLSLDCGALLGARSLFRRSVVLDARFRRIAVAAIVGLRGHPERGKTQGRNDECGCRVSHHVPRDCARPVATTSPVDSLGFAAD
jgi:hypothetical protein